ncbi:PREDICTED: uncharacterized protein LOC105569910, partial [Vollenhovia emeryi]|uniref:uncharacterized protein LOC105569910 n=1 Tax=Vollenhovia emeryi TaxID=411798 RepID=UPI0005F54E10
MDGEKQEGALLGVPSLQPTRATSRSPSPTDSLVTVRGVSPAGTTRSQATVGQLSTELALKVRAQMNRLTLLQERQARLPTMTSLEQVLELKSNVVDTLKVFLKEHAYFEAVWPASCLDHAYFADNVFLEAQRVASFLKEEIAKTKGSLLAQPSCSSTGSTPVTHTKLPDITLPEFNGNYPEWPTFRDLFKSLILENARLSDVERLHYLRGCLKGAPERLVIGFPLTAQSLSLA